MEDKESVFFVVCLRALLQHIYGPGVNILGSRAVQIRLGSPILQNIDRGAISAVKTYQCNIDTGFLLGTMQTRQTFPRLDSGPCPARLRLGGMKTMYSLHVSGTVALAADSAWETTRSPKIGAHSRVYAVR
jgi:hypothetical protein